ncbi:MAG: hypothetical protein JNL01_08435 [Bdellovibrionales bacterium]|nr:hypothetical protein [Bdellovibrionales bacterium]
MLKAKNFWVNAIFLNLALSATWAGPAWARKIHLTIPVGEKKSDQRAPANQGEPRLVYLSWNKIGIPTILSIRPDVWRGEKKGPSGDSIRRFRSNTRAEVLMQLFYANDREESTRGLRHIACFQGDPVAVVREFFTDTPIEVPDTESQEAIMTFDVKPTTEIDNLQGDMDISYSQDRFMLGIGGVMQRKISRTETREVPFHFRLPSCDLPGKNSIIPSSLIGKVTGITAKQIEDLEKGRFLNAEFKAEAERAPAQVNRMAEGFEMKDTVSGHPNLPRFDLRGDFQNSTFTESRDRPWKNMDISTPKKGEAFAILMLDYFMEGMVTQDPSNPDQNLIAKNNTSRFWCNMPWMQVGASGREAIHGMTRERNLGKNAIYKDTTSGTNWGVAYYNGRGCEALNGVFGNESNPKRTMDLTRNVTNPVTRTKSYFQDGTVAVKVLFTTANFPSLNGAFTWNGNVTTAEGSNARSVQPVRLIQIDIAVRDSTLRGARADLDYWVMTSYYFDANYKSKYRTTRAPSGWLKMRPQGVQLGFDAADSLLATGAISNGHENRLNGPADNPKSSCLSCHGTAGTTTAMSPGFMSNSQYGAVQGKTMDFSQQLSMAKRNFETRPRRGN